MSTTMMGLQWEAHLVEDGLDLHGITPGLAEISFREKYDPVSGGQLDVDHRGRKVNRWVENIVFPRDGTAPLGHTYFVHNFMQHGNGSDAWSLTVSINDELTESSNGVTFSYLESTRFKYEWNPQDWSSWLALHVVCLLLTRYCSTLTDVCVFLMNALLKFTWINVRCTD
jgi:hypothetical protein